MTQFHDTLWALLHWFDYEMSETTWMLLVVGFSMLTALSWALWRDV